MHKISTITLNQIELMYGEISFELDYQTEEEMLADAWYVKGEARGEAQKEREAIIKFLKKVS